MRRLKNSDSYQKKIGLDLKNKVLIVVIIIVVAAIVNAIKFALD